MTASFRDRLRGGATLLGSMQTLPAAAVGEIMAAAGFDWLFIDGEHGPIDSAELLSILQAVSHQVPCVYRVPELGAAAIKRALDSGVAGIIVPQVETEAQARSAVQFSRYAPDGERGVGLARAHRYGFAFREHLANANDEIAVIVQAEHIRAAENIDRIAAVPGLDAVFLGPYDLSASLGRPGDIDHPDVVEAIDHVTRTCQARGIALGYFGLDAQAVAPMRQRGYTLICAGIDCVLLGQHARQLLNDMRG